ncbi:MAG: ABC transporter substrate-binding protein [Candidatus Endonucleobacter sp. (ex Gigantidas childressi)]|nr:ABC transporter substrate-binding protein [Candidatus Endonucleobacter sp. (ex Gigantidas childressi)]
MNTQYFEFMSPKWLKPASYSLLSLILLLNTSICVTIANAKDMAKGIDKEMGISSPSEEAQKVTESLLKTFRDNKKRYQKDNEAYLEEVDKLLSPVVAFDSISRGVMGKYAHRAKPSQIKQFETTFKKSLIAFYGKALLKIDSTNTTIQPVKDVSDKILSNYKQGKIRQVPVEISVASNHQIIILSYAMILTGGRWKLRNIIVDGINIGSLFRKQFMEAMDDHRDIQYVVNNWLDIMNNTSQTETNKNEKK